MDIIDTASSGAHIAGELKNTPVNLRKRPLGIPSRTLRSALEHLPSVNLRRLRIEKHVALSILIPVNLTMIYMFTDYTKFFWYLFPILILRSWMDFVEISLIIIFYIYQWLYPHTPKIPHRLESFVYLFCCYNETYPELMISLDSLAEQKQLDAHKKAIIVVCDGRVRGKGMSKTAAAHLKEDIIEHPTSTLMSEAYTAWDGSSMDVEIVRGEFRGLPVICLIKNENRGKRDGIILIRSFLHKFNQRESKPSLAMLSPKLFAELTGFVTGASIRSVDYAVGIDADTRFDPECVFNLIQAIRESDRVMGVTGYIRPDPKTLGPFSISYLYQNAEYMVGQHRRRLRQSLTSGRVTCLPGCCQILRVAECTMGDDILGKFGYYPRDTDGLFRTVRSMMSEDRDHVCLVLAENAHVQTRVCLSAWAFTTAPTTPSVFLSQRRRWTLGPLTSDSLLVSRKSTGWVERVAAMSSLIHLLVNPALFLSKFYRRVDPTTRYYLFFFENYRMVWDLLVIVVSMGSPTEAVQLFVGSMMYGYFAPLVNFITHLYTLYKLDDFRWGKTRVVVAQKAET
ncbi:chitin synthase [Pyrenophora tritici-repentis]|uniref:chitin synthase n=2 Tax=Pyrenophora tritici-repentis TaxID=45151 RepID=A0A2W1GGJ5_9PLEO|nr:chitin synthase [Pyrenophora tritici-repentis Pt-1C-BFP]KAA8620397.1 Glycosyltransferase family 2 protein [Pyrenophora tritici-repentis]EDU46390.1 chitin synthase [Pyrenophora tritici-repentis Pt-1C-BFP]KAF7448555.1 Glycosyltransferase family 2 protein [Pyrenophora tritici-repentis]KAF7572277.1 chitin synthase [Pyrenophora tritici-repentis]KAG9384547.1 Glycosyltransferase family 2 protein [Pyrenophora tritici-repentis]